MMDFKDMLLDAMKQGVSLEDVMKGISAAATEVEKEQKRAAERRNKYLAFTKPIGASMRPTIASANIIDTNKINDTDMAIVLTHYICQNAPGYAELAAKEDLDLIDMYRALAKAQVSIAKTLAAHKDDVDNALFNGLADSMISTMCDRIFGNAPSNDKTECKISPPYSFAAGPFGSAKSDVEKITEFLKRFDF